MGVYIKGMEMPGACLACDFCNPFAEEPYCRRLMKITPKTTTLPDCPLIELPSPHGDLIDRDALIKDGWLNLRKEVMRMGGYAIHELPLKNPSIPVIVPADEDINALDKEEGE